MASVIVVGAGIAGLTAAYHMSRFGVRVTVLEAAGRVGGRMSTDERGGYLIDRGAQFLSDGYSVIGQLIAEMGLSGRRCRASGWSGTVRDGRVRSINARFPWSPATSGLLSWRDLLRMARATFSLARETRQLSLSDYSCWHALDDANAADWVGAIFGKDALEYFFEPMLEGFYFHPPEGTSRALAALLWAFGARRHSVMALSGGIGSLPEALAKRLDVRRETPVLSIERDAGGVRVETRSDVLHADYAVLATTASSARALYSPGSDVEARLLNTNYSASINIGVAVPNGISTVNARKDIYGLLIPRRERQVIAAVAVESHKCRQYVPRGELLNVMLSGSAAARLVGAPEEEVLAEVIPELDKYFPGIKPCIEFTHFCRWREAEPYSPIGRSADLRDYRQLWRPNMRVVLAGDYMSIPCTEGAAESGRWAGTSIGAALSR